MKKPKLLPLLLALIAVLNTSHAQLVNGLFTSGLSGWSSSPGLGGPIVWPVSNSSNNWCDLTGSLSGNGGWIEQPVSGLTVGHVYRLRMKLGTMYSDPQYKCEAGVEVYINGLPLHAGSIPLYPRLLNTTFAGSANQLNWQVVTSERFMVTCNITTIRLTGNSMGCSAPGGPEYIGVDDIELIDEGDPYSIVVTPGANCREFCFTCSNDRILGLNSFNGGTVYINGVSQGLLSNVGTMCRQLPKNTNNEIRLHYTATLMGTSVQYGGCPMTNLSKTITTHVVTESCACDLQNHVSMTSSETSCNQFLFNLNFTPGYGSLFTQWTVDGQAVSGSLTSVLVALTPGTHTICASLTGKMDGEDDDNLCCAKLCEVITIPEIQIEQRTVTYCPLQFPSGPLYEPCPDCNEYYEFYKNDSLKGSTPANGCDTSYLLDAPAKLYCYKMVNGQPCLRKLILLTPQAMNVGGMVLPDETVTVCEGNTKPYVLDCGPEFPNYEISGPNGFYLQGYGAVLLQLEPGYYTITCMNYATCTKTRRGLNVVPQAWTISSCEIMIDDCSVLNSRDALIEAVNANGDCGSCSSTIANDLVFPFDDTQWEHGPSYISPGPPYSSYKFLTRVFTDPINCRKCSLSVRVNYADFGAKMVKFYTDGADCLTITPGMLTGCLANKTIDAYNMEDHNTIFPIDTRYSFQLCCVPSPEHATPYYLYDREDPCCFMIIIIDCSPGGIIEGRSGQFGSPLTAPEVRITPGTANNVSFKIVPNPTSSVFRIASDQTETSYDKVEITDMTGRIILARSNVSSSYVFDLSRQNKGVYMVNVTIGSKRASLKLILNE